MACVLRSLFVVDFFFVKEGETLAFNFDVVVLLVLLADVLRSASIVGGVLFLLAFLLLLLLLGAPDCSRSTVSEGSCVRNFRLHERTIVDIEKLHGDNIALKGAVAVL